MDDVFTCAYCFEPNSVFIDPSGGLSQSYVEDCQVCCQPNVLFIQWDDSLEDYTVEAQPES